MSALSELDRSKVIHIDLGSSEFKQNARDILANWAKRPPFYVLSSGPAQVICGRYADVHEIFSDTERFSSELPRGHGFEQFDKFMGVQFITQMDGERHARIRRLLMPAFSARSLSRLETRIVEIIHGMLDKIEAGGNEFDGMRDYGAQLVVGALLTAMANLSESQKEIFLAFQEVLPLTTYTKPGEPFAPECVQAFERAAQLVREIIAQRRAHPRPDFINDLITARDQGDKLTDRELFDQIFTICGAALSATSRAAGGALYLTPISSRNSFATQVSFPRRSRSACASRATGISHFRAWPRATPRSAGPKSSRAWWCGPRRRRRTTTRRYFRTRCASISIAIRSGSWPSAPDRITASATFSAAPRLRSPYAACSRASPVRGSPIPISFRATGARSGNYACNACR
jgi:hypothetical protein